MNILQMIDTAQVQWKALGEVASYIRGLTYSKVNESPDGIGYKVLRANNITLSTNVLNFNDVKSIKFDTKVKDSKKLYKNDILISAASGSREHVGKVAFIYDDLDFYFGGFMGVVRCSDEVNPRYLFHILTSSIFHNYLNDVLNSSTINNLNSGVMSQFKIPVPSLSLQKEIVKILDKFTELEATLEATLEAELHLRTQQYGYYRDSLLSFGEHVPRKALGEVAQLQRGTTITAKSASVGNIPVISGGQKPAYFVGDMNRDGETITIAGSGAYAGFVMYWNEPIFVSDAFSVKPNEELCLTKYAYYFLLNNQTKIFGMQKGTGVPHVYPKDVGALPIPLPPLEEQQRIVDILDHFDTLTHSISEGLPREIALRRQQYAYYREKLLHFTQSPRSPV